METSGRRKAGDRGSVKTTKKESKKGKGRGEKGRTRRIAFCLCSIKGEITHLLRFFLKTTALIDQTAWMYQPIFNMKYRHQKSITPVFSLPSVICSSLLTKVDASTSLSALLSVCLSFSPMDLPLSPSDMYIMLSTRTHLLDKWGSRSYSIII